MQLDEYARFRKFLEDACGIVLGDNKQYLVTSRLSRILRDNDISDLGELVNRIGRPGRSELRDQVVEAMTTNETSWFRDNHPYLTLEDRFLPELARSRKNPVRVWSAACSSGQEPYSISMVYQDFQMKNPGLMSAALQVVATDISPAIIKAASLGRYDGLAMARGIPQERKNRYFRQVGDEWEVNAQIKSCVQFRELNLLQSYALLGKFDIIFCRNVLIYFSTELKRDILARMAQSLNRGGYLFLGGSESLTGISDRFEMIRHNGGVIYQLKD
jgi:chemotaxis protein methyltransferase CheR